MLELRTGEKNNSKAQIQLIDMIGRTAYSEHTQINNVVAKEITISSKLSHGMYMVRVLANNTTYKAPLVYVK